MKARRFWICALCSSLLLAGCAPSRLVVETGHPNSLINGELEGENARIEFMDGSRSRHVRNLTLSDSLVTYETVSGTEMQRPISEVRQISYVRGKGAGLGAALGAAPGAALVGIALLAPCDPSLACAIVKPFLAIVGFGAAAVGAIIGSIFGGAANERVVLYDVHEQVPAE